MLDASAALAALLGDDDPQRLRYARATFERMRPDGDLRAVVPAAWHLEVGAVLMRGLRSRSLARPAVEEVLRTIAEIPLETATETPDVASVVAAAGRFGLAAADALYVDLALEERLPIATVDGGMRAAASRHRIAVLNPFASA